MIDRASRYERWLDEQSLIVTTPGDGSVVSPAKIILEMEGEVWGTWQANAKDLAELVRTVVVRIGEELPKGQHGAKLLAIDSAGQTLAQHPLTIRGNSTASRHGTEQMEMQRAMTILVGNLEAVSHSLTSQIELLSRQNQDLIGQNLSAISALQEVVSAKGTIQIDIQRQEARDARLAEIVRQVAPALDIGLTLIFQHFASKIPGMQSLAAPTPPAAPAAPAAPQSSEHGGLGLAYASPAASPQAAPLETPPARQTPPEAPSAAPPAAPTPPAAPPPKGEPVVDLAALDAHRSMGGSRKRPAKPPTRVAKPRGRK
jgi:hypothetical protein